MIENQAIIEGVVSRPKWTDQSQSLGLFFESPNLKALSEMLILAWNKGIEGIYHLTSARYFWREIGQMFKETIKIFTFFNEIYWH
jgi:ribonucleotide reductase alpha subunit